jgi:hypothetical protein
MAMHVTYDVPSHVMQCPHVYVTPNKLAKPAHGACDSAQNANKWCTDVPPWMIRVGIDVRLRPRFSFTRFLPSTTAAPSNQKKDYPIRPSRSALGPGTI